MLTLFEWYQGLTSSGLLGWASEHIWIQLLTQAHVVTSLVVKCVCCHYQQAQ